MHTSELLACVSTHGRGFRRAFPANRWFFRRNRRISRIACFARCNATSELSTTIATREMRK